MNLKSSWYKRLKRPLLLFFLLSILVSLSVLTAQSSPPAASGNRTREDAGSPPPQVPSGPMTVFLPVASKALFIDLAFSSVQVIQGTSPSAPYAVYVADRPTTVRALVSLQGNESTISGVMGRMYGYDSGGSPLGSVDSNSITAPSVVGEMARTLNFSVPSSWLKPGYSYSISLDPGNTIPEYNKDNNRYPASGSAPFGFSSAQTVNVVIVPILYLPYGLPDSSQPKTDNLSYLEWMQPEVLPVPAATSGIQYTLHPTVAYEPNPFASQPTHNLDDPSGAGWQDLLNQISAVHEQEDPGGAKVYYGLANIYDAHNGCGGCVTGMGWIGDHVILPTAVGWSGAPNGSADASKTMTHEMGHNFGREHVLCAGNEEYPDPNYPYAGGKIGVWGLDVASGTLYDPSIYADYMSYCPATWTSDYTYAGIKNFRNTATYAPAGSAQAGVQALFVSGTLSPSGEVKFQPIFEQKAAVRNSTTGSYVLELIGQGGTTLARYPFNPSRIADSKGASGFGFFVPAAPGLTGLRVRKGSQTLGEKQVPAALVTTRFATEPLSVQRTARGTTIRWSPVTHPAEPIFYNVRISRDGGASWQVLAVNRRSVQLTVQPDVDLSNTILEVQATDGVHVTTRSITLGRLP